MEERLAWAHRLPEISPFHLLLVSYFQLSYLFIAVSLVTRPNSPVTRTF